ncbi:unnamed protein product, partial [Sphacelaria rigidula]
RRRPRSAALRTVVAVSISLVSRPHLGLIVLAASQLDAIFADDQGDVVAVPSPRLQEGSYAAHNGGKSVDAQQGVMPASPALSSGSSTDSAAVAVNVGEGDSKVEVHGCLPVQGEGVSRSADDHLRVHVCENKREHEDDTCGSEDESEEPMAGEDSVAVEFCRPTIRSATCSGVFSPTWNPNPFQGNQEEHPYTILPSNKGFKAFSERSATRPAVDSDSGGICNAGDGIWTLGQCHITDGSFDSDRPAGTSSDISIEQQQREAIELRVSSSEDSTNVLDNIVDGQCESTETEDEGRPEGVTCGDYTLTEGSKTYDSARYGQSAADTEEESESARGEKRDEVKFPAAVAAGFAKEVVHVVDAFAATAEALGDATSDPTATAAEGQLGDVFGQPGMRDHYSDIIPEVANTAVSRGKDTASEVDEVAAGKLKAENPSATDSSAEVPSASWDAGDERSTTTAVSPADEVPLTLSEVDKVVDDDDDSEPPLELWSRGFLERASDTEAGQSSSGDAEAGEGGASSTTITSSNSDFVYEDSLAVGVPPALDREEVRGPRMTGVGVVIPIEDVSSEESTLEQTAGGYGASADDVAAATVPVLTKQAKADVLAAQATLEAILAEPKPNEKGHCATTDDVATANALATAAPNEVRTLAATRVGRDPAPQGPNVVLVTPVELAKGENMWTKTSSLWSR